MSIKYIDLFAGVGGFRYGLEKCNTRTQEDSGTLGRVGDGNENGGDLHIGQQLRERFDCVYSNEWDKYANSVYRKQFGECDDRDIREVEADELPEFDMLCGGFPCQAFSVAGKRGGFNDTRGTLFFEIARIAKQKQPRLLLLENVKGLLSHDKGRTFGTILNTLDELGYDVQWQVLNSKNFGVPQNRERVIIIGHLRGTSRPEVFPIEGSSGASLKSLSKGESQGNRIYTTDGLSATIASQAGGLGAKTGLYVAPVLTPNRENKRQNGRRFKEDGEPSFTLTQQDQHGVMLSRTVRAGGRGSTDEKHRWDIINDGVQIRRLTPKECERLQGFPDDWTKFDDNDNLISDTQRYKMMGNAVSTPVITAIGEKLLM